MSCARWVAASALGGGPGDWRAGAEALQALDGHGWLLLDQAARTSAAYEGAPVGGPGGWLGNTLGEGTGFVAAVTSLHVDGRFRERATQVLGTTTSRHSTAALGVRLLDHVPEVRPGRG